MDTDIPSGKVEEQLNPWLKMAFKVIWTAVTKRRMAATPLVKACDEKKNIRTRLGACAIRLVGRPLRLEGGPKAFDDGVVVAIAGAAHADR